MGLLRRPHDFYVKSRRLIPAALSYSYTDPIFLYVEQE